MATTRAERSGRLLEGAADRYRRRRIAEGGLVALRARDVAAEAGSALGGIYTPFADPTTVRHVNARPSRSDRRAEQAEGAGNGWRSAGDGASLPGCAGESQPLGCALTPSRRGRKRRRRDWFAAIDGAATCRRAPAALEPGRGASGPGRTYFAAVHGDRVDEPAAAAFALAGRSVRAEPDAFVDRRSGRGWRSGFRPCG